MARYQQGIGTKDASEVPSTFQAPTMWQEPKAPAINRVNFTPANTGAQRNYGSTPQYVDTVKSRWEHGEKGALIGAATGLGSQAYARNQQQQVASSRGTDTGPATNPAWSTTQRQRAANWQRR
jgi:hypothetical protein